MLPTRALWSSPFRKAKRTVRLTCCAKFRRRRNQFASAGSNLALWRLWSSSEVPDAGMGLLDYQTNAAVDRWLRERVLLTPTTTSCVVPKGVFVGEGAMLRAIAYGHELNLVHPPRPSDPKVAWEPEWAVKVRVKSLASAVVGMPSMDEAMRGTQREGTEPQPEQTKEKKPGPLDILRGVLGR